jgi:hypothetical protein
VLPIQELVIVTPGAKRSTTAPKLENEAIASAIVVAPMVFADGALAGLVVPASVAEFPAATLIQKDKSSINSANVEYQDITETWIPALVTFMALEA